MTQQPSVSNASDEAITEPVGLLDLWPEVMERRAAFLRAIDVTEEQARHHLGGKPEEWCMLQVAQHVLGWTENVADVIEAIAAGDLKAKLPRGYIREGLPDTLAEVRAALIHASIRFSTLPERMPAAPNAEVTVEHEVYGPMNYRGWFGRCGAHDLDHTGQANALRREILGEA